ncbi:MAG: FAD-dependent oxidoreductase [Anaerolineaceae bacterium]|nr:FAD-dependent oxidoreductase [Anaerolineaceae bacterium]
MMNTVYEQARELPVVQDCDVVVCGGGPAGVAAAITAARAGARTQLIELNGCLGGVWTAGLLCWIIDARDKPGVMQEIITRLNARGACTIDEKKIVDFEAEPLYRGKDLERDFSYDPEAMKLLLEEMCAEAGVIVRLHTRVVAAAKDDRNRAAFVITESKSGREAWTARTFIDCTGDGDLAARLGCGFDMGRPDSGQVQPMTLMMLVTGIDAQAVEPYITEWHAGLNPPKQRLLEAIRQGGFDISYTKPCLMRIYDNLFVMAVNHEYGVMCDDADAISQATLRARGELHRTVNALRALGGIWAGLRIVATGEQIGVREGRRIHGRYTVSRDDLIEGAQQPDSVARVTFPVDVHSTDKDKDKSYSREGVTAKPYDIPLRALIARDVDGLLLAGRCISGDFIAHASYRVTGNAVAMGQCAGACAAQAALSNQLPHEVAYADVAETVERVTGTRVAS